MYIDQNKCIKCGRCIPYCPRDAIVMADGHLTIDLERCVECGVCQRNAKCPRDAIQNLFLEYPRAYRKAFSDPFGKHENTAMKHAGRGTEEVKTNDVTGVVHSKDRVTFAAELGRPGVGASFRDVEKVAMAVAPYAVGFEGNNPVTPLILDKKTGKMDEAVMGESVMSAIVEFSCLLTDAQLVLEALKAVSKRIDTVFSLCIICKVDEAHDTLPVQRILEELDIDVHKTSAKTNLGLGRPCYEDRLKQNNAIKGGC